MHAYLLLWLLLFCANQRFPLGPLGAVAEVTPGSNEAVIVDVTLGAPGQRAGLRGGDRIVGAAGKMFVPHTKDTMDGGRGPQKALGEAIDSAAGGKLVLTLKGTRGERELTVSLPKRPAFRSGFPKDCEASRALRGAAAKQLIATQKENGSWDSPVGLSGDRVLAAWAVIALIAHGDPEQREAIARGAQWLHGPEGKAWIPDDFSRKGPDNLGNWPITATAVALAEHCHAVGGEADLHESVLQRCAKALAARMTVEGLFGHDVTPGYEGKGFNVINTLAHFAWASAHAAGVALDEKAWNASLEQIRRSVDPNGGVRYWTIPGTGTWDASLRTGSMALALSLVGREAELRKKFADYLAKHAPRAREAHAVGSMGMMVSAPALWAIDRDGWREFMGEWRWYLTLMWGHDDRIHYIGGKGNNGGDGYLGMDRMACIIALMLLTCPDENLRLHSSPKAG